MIVKPDFDRDGRQWPNRSASRFLRAGGLRWHVQVMGAGPPLLLLHGAGAATHSWRSLAPLLARDFTVIAPDLPGHGFTDTPRADGLSLPGMARGVSALMDALGQRPTWLVGHSAGAAIALRMRLDDRTSTAGVVSLNGALAPFGGAAAPLFPAMAKLLFMNPMAIQMFAWRAGRPGGVERLIESTGSRIDRAGLEAYGRLIRTSGHVAGALGMMAQWDLRPLRADLRKIDFPLTLMAAQNDRAVPPSVAREIKALVPHAALVDLPGLGHLAHEESPGLIGRLIAHAAGIDAAQPKVYPDADPCGQPLSQPSVKSC